MGWVSNAGGPPAGGGVGAGAAAPALGVATGYGFFYDTTIAATAVSANGTETATFQGGFLKPYTATPPLAYFFNDFLQTASPSALYATPTATACPTGGTWSNGNVFNNYNSVGAGAAQTDLNHPGAIMLQTTNVPGGGCFTGLANALMDNTNTRVHTWRMCFSMPTQASALGNRYTFAVGAFLATAGSLNNGPYITYSDNVNSGKWVLNSAHGAVQITVNSTVAVPSPGSWNTLVIVGIAGVFTFTLNGVSLGTVTDTNYTAGIGQPVVTHGSMSLCAATFTSVTYCGMDSCDYTLTGLTR